MRSSSSTTRESHILEFAAAIIKQLGTLSAPWQRPWESGLPRNLVSTKPYRGSNALRLMTGASERGYRDPRWATYRQINQARGRVRKGERSTPILFIKSYFVKDPSTDSLGEDSDIWKVVPKFRKRIQYWAEHRVFNVEQTTDLKLSPVNRKPWDVHEKAEEMIQMTGVKIVHSARHIEATYFPGGDRIEIPTRETFPTADSYYRTVLHELAHATGHVSRLQRECMEDGRKKTLQIGEVAREELRAEICSMLVNTTLGIQHDPMHGTAYIKEWISILDDDPAEIYRATTEAQKMADYLLSHRIGLKKA